MAAETSDFSVMQRMIADPGHFGGIRACLVAIAAG
jgi:hypothetical protein